MQNNLLHCNINAIDGVAEMNLLSGPGNVPPAPCETVMPQTTDAAALWRDYAQMSTQMVQASFAQGLAAWTGALSGGLPAVRTQPAPSTATNPFEAWTALWTNALTNAAPRSAAMPTLPAMPWQSMGWPMPFAGQQPSPSMFGAMPMPNPVVMWSMATSPAAHDLMRATFVFWAQYAQMMQSSQRASATPDAYSTYRSGGGHASAQLADPVRATAAVFNWWNPAARSV